MADRIHTLMSIIDDNSQHLTENDYLRACNTLKELYYERETMALDIEVDELIIIQRHENKKKWTCGYCKKRFKRSYNKKRHYNRCRVKRKQDEERAHQVKLQQKLNKEISILRLVNRG